MNILRLQSKNFLGHINSIGWNSLIQYCRSGHYFLDMLYVQYKNCTQYIGNTAKSLFVKVRWTSTACAASTRCRGPSGTARRRSTASRRSRGTRSRTCTKSTSKSIFQYFITKKTKIKYHLFAVICWLKMNAKRLTKFIRLLRRTVQFIGLKSCDYASHPHLLFITSFFNSIITNYFDHNIDRHYLFCGGSNNSNLWMCVLQ
mgnify:CR=1 FL=1